MGQNFSSNRPANPLLVRNSLANLFGFAKVNIFSDLSGSNIPLAVAPYEFDVLVQVLRMPAQLYSGKAKNFCWTNRPKIWAAQLNFYLTCTNVVGRPHWRSYRVMADKFILPQIRFPCTYMGRDGTLRVGFDVVGNSIGLHGPNDWLVVHSQLARSLTFRSLLSHDRYWFLRVPRKDLFRGIISWSTKQFCQVRLHSCFRWNHQKRNSVHAFKTVR